MVGLLPLVRHHEWIFVLPAAIYAVLLPLWLALIRVFGRIRGKIAPEKGRGKRTQILKAIETQGRVDIGSLAVELGLSEEDVKEVIYEAVSSGEIEGFYRNPIEGEFIGGLEAEMELLRLLRNLRRVNESGKSIERVSLRRLSRELMFPMEQVINVIQRLRSRGELFGVVDLDRGEYVNIDYGTIEKISKELGRKTVLIANLAKTYGLDAGQAVELIRYMLKAGYVEGSFSADNTRFQGIEPDYVKRGGEIVVKAAPREVIEVKVVPEAPSISKPESQQSPRAFRSKPKYSQTVLKELGGLSRVGPLVWKKQSKRGEFAQ